MIVSELKDDKKATEERIGRLLAQELAHFQMRTGVFVKNVDIHYRAIPLLGGHTDYVIEKVSLDLDL